MRKGFTLIELMIVIAIIAIIAAIAIPNLLESRVTANEGAAAASLKSGIFPGEVQFQAGAYEDGDQNNVGEYGTIETLAGLIKTAKIAAGNLKLVQGAMAAGAAGGATRSGNGYVFASFISESSKVSDGTNEKTWIEGAAPTDFVATPMDTSLSNERVGERYFIVGCQPEMWGDSGRRVFFITQEGQVRSPSTSLLMTNWYGGNDPSTAAGVTDRPADKVRLRSGMVHALTKASADVTDTTDLTGNTYHAALPDTFNTDYPVLAK